MSWPERLYRALLLCYPAEFRCEYASEMAQVVRDRMRHESKLGLWPELIADVALTASREHFHMLMQDLRYTARTLRQSPVFTAAALLTVALGIGANTAIFSVVNAVMLRPLPFPAPDRLVQVAEKNDKLGLPYFGASLLNYLSWKEQAQSFEALGAFGFGNYTLTGNGAPEQFTGAPITPSLLPLLGLQPVAGRGFREGEDQPGGPAVAMIGESLWRRRFGGDPGLVGRSLRLNGVEHTVVGIAPAALATLASGDIWTPMIVDQAKEARLNHVIFAVGRLKRGTALSQAQAEMNAVATRVGRQYPEVRDWGINLRTFHDWFVAAPLRTTLLVLLGAVGFVLLIACANVANLLLSRAVSRQKEIAVRLAMGASRPRLVRQLLTESLTLSIGGGAAGLMVAAWSIRLMNQMLPPNLLPVPDVPVDANVLCFAAAAAVVTGILFGIAPAWHASRTDLDAVLRQGGRAATGGVHPLLRGGLAAAELALATVLLIGAGLLIQTLLHLQRVPLGFEPGRLLTFQLSLPPAKYHDEKAWGFYRGLLDSLRGIPGVRAAAVSSGIPFGAGNYNGTPVGTKGKSELPAGASLKIDWRLASPGYFRAMEIPLSRGRDFTEADLAKDAPPVIVVSQGMARRFWGADDPIGRIVHRVGDRKDFTVVGVVGDVRMNALNQQAPSMYFPANARVLQLMDIVVRTERDPLAVLGTVRRKVKDLDPELPVFTVRTMDSWVSDSAAQPRLNAVLLGIFAAIALLIAAIGIYGVLAYSVTQRTREIGLRVALGARRGDVLRLVIGQGMLVSGAGILAGLLCAFGASRVLQSLLFGLSGRDVRTFAAVAIVLAAISLAACFFPAWRAARVDPMTALRQE